MAVFLSPVGGVAAQFFTNSGVILSGGKLYTYAAGTTTPLASYTTSAGSTARTNPIVLDSAGRVPDGGEIWLNSSLYKFVLKDSTDVLIATWDNVFGAGANTIPVIYNSTGTGSQTTYALGGTPINENTTNVFVSGVYQQKNTYSVSGGSLIFSEAPPVNCTIEVTYF